MSLRTLLARRPSQNTPATTASQQPKKPAVMQFLTAGGATVQVIAHTFSTRYVTGTRGYVNGDEQHDVDGFVWSCHGCSATGATDGSLGVFFDGRYLPREITEARKDANRHATACRAMPRPTA